MRIFYDAFEKNLYMSFRGGRFIGRREIFLLHCYFIRFLAALRNDTKEDYDTVSKAGIQNFHFDNCVSIKLVISLLEGISAIANELSNDSTPRA